MPSKSSPSRSSWLASYEATAISVAAAAATSYYTALGCGMVYDDIAAVQENRDVRTHTPFSNLFFNDFWGTPLHKEQSHKSYRPLCVLTFRLNFAAHGLQPFGYHLVNVLLHCLVCLLYHRTCLYFVPKVSSFVAALLFSAHPIHTEAVTSIVGRAELLSAVFFLSALIFYMHSGKQLGSGTVCWKRCFITVAIACVGMLCKEQCLTVLAVCCVYELLSAKSRHPSRYPVLRLPWLRDALLRASVLMGSAVTVLSLRLRMNGIHMPVFNRFDNPASVMSTPTRQLTYNYLLAVNVWLLVFPCDLCCDWSMGTVPLVTSLLDTRNLATLAVYLVFLALLRAALKADDRHKMPLFMGIAMMVFPFLPASNLLHPVGFVVAERVLYLPSLGFCLLVAYGWSFLWHKRCKRKLAIAGLISLLAFHVAKTALRNMDWTSEHSLYTSALKVNLRNAKLFNNMGQALENMNRHEEAYDYYRKAIRIQPDDIRGFLNSGRVLTFLRRYQEAETAYLQAKSLFPKPGAQPAKVTRVTSSHLQVFLDLASLISQNHSRLEEADALYKQAISMRSDFTDAYLNRGDFLLRMNRTKEAEAMYERALELDENNPDLYYNLGVVLMDQGRSQEALSLFNRALDLDPDHEHALMNSAILIQEAGMASLKQIANERLRKMVHQGKQNEKVYFDLAMLALENKDPRVAEQWFRKAVQIKPNLRSALFNLAFLLSEQQRPLEAIAFLKELLKHHPDHVKGLVLLGDIQVNHLKDLEAAENCYHRILSLDPDNVQGYHNLCVVYFERGEFSRAERCFLHAVTLDPGADYIRKHLQVTRSLLRRRHSGKNSNTSGDHKVSSVFQQFASSATVQ